MKYTVLMILGVVITWHMGIFTCWFIGFLIALYVGTKLLKDEQKRIEVREFVVVFILSLFSWFLLVLMHLGKTIKENRKAQKQADKDLL